MTESTTPAVADAFLRRFTIASDTGDRDLLAGCFAEVFLAGDATGVQPVPREAFLAAVPGRRQAFTDAGIGNAVLAAHRVNELDEHYLLVSTQWTAPRLDGGPDVELSSSFLLYCQDETATAVAYLNHRGI